MNLGGFGFCRPSIYLWKFLYQLYLTMSGSFYFYYWFKLLFGVIYLSQYSVDPTWLCCVIIVKYITLQYVIDTTIQLPMCCFKINLEKKRKYAVILFLICTRLFLLVLFVCECGFSWDNLVSALKMFFTVSCKVGQPALNSLSFCLSWKVALIENS